MDARSYLTTIVVPTLREAIADNRDMRRSYVATIVAYHLIDYLASTLSAKSPGARHTQKAVSVAISALNRTAYDIVLAVANGAKHSKPDRRATVQFEPGTDRIAFPAFHGVGFVGFQVWGDKIGGRQIDLGDGRKVHLLPAVLSFLRAAQEAFPEEIGGVELP